MRRSLAAAAVTAAGVAATLLAPLAGLLHIARPSREHEVSIAPAREHGHEPHAPESAPQSQVIGTVIVGRAFQPDAFQDDAFQVGTSMDVVINDFDSKPPEPTP